MEKFKNKYRIPSTRLEGYDYGQNGAYFITICTKNREYNFGEIKNGKMILSPCGVLADVFWHEILHHTEGVELGAFQVMPNHIHGILILNRDEFLPVLPESSAELSDTVVADTVETLHATSLQSPQSTESSEKKQKMSDISPNAGSVSTILRSYKSAVTKHANRLELPNGWQTRFHDHIIRNEAEYQRIDYYIENNVLNWEKDCFHPTQPPPPNIE
ncbi:MAG: transposase [Saprospiraceae bacterium]|nr:transposase [Saprospiraceae bacterium]